MLLDSGRTDRRGQIFFQGDVDTCSMPYVTDARYEYGARILLLPSANFETTDLSWSDPISGLEGTHLIRFLDIDDHCDGPTIIFVDEGEESSTPTNTGELPPHQVPDDLPPHQVPES